MNKALKAFTGITLGLTLALLLAEILLRTFGFKPYYADPNSMRMDSLFLKADSRLGYTLRPGQFNVVLGGNLHYQALHNVDGSRNTGELADSVKTRIHVYGCSFTYGMGVADSATFCFLMQDTLKAIGVEIKNFGCPGYGQLQMLLEMKENAVKEQVPDVVLMYYMADHNERNILDTWFRRNVQKGIDISNYRQNAELLSSPFLEKVGESWVVKYKLWDQHMYKGIWLREYSAFCNLLDESVAKASNNREDAHRATEYIIAEMSEFWREKGVRFMVMSLTDDEATKEMMNRLSLSGTETHNIGFDVYTQGYNNLPYDPHPNALAHKIYTANTLEALQPVIRDKSATLTSFLR